MGGQAAVRPYTGLLAWHGAPEFLSPLNAGSNYELGHSLEMPVVVGGAEDVLEGVYICRGANRDVYRCVLRARRDLGGFVLKVGTTRYGQNASLSELLLLELGFRGGIAVCFYAELPRTHMTALHMGYHVTILVEPVVMVAKDYLRNCMTRFRGDETAEALVVAWELAKEVGLWVLSQARQWYMIDFRLENLYVYHGGVAYMGF